MVIDFFLPVCLCLIAVRKTTTTTTTTTTGRLPAGTQWGSDGAMAASRAGQEQHDLALLLPMRNKNGETGQCLGDQRTTEADSERSQENRHFVF